MRIRWTVVLVGVLALVGGFVFGWALRGSGFDVSAFEAVGTWVGALVSALAVGVALYLGYESEAQKRKRDRQLDQDMTYTQHLLEGARRAQAGRIELKEIVSADDHSQPTAAYPFTLWAVMYSIHNRSDETVRDVQLTLNPEHQECYQANRTAGDDPLQAAWAYILPTLSEQPSFNVPMPIGVIGTDSTLRPSLRFTDATGQCWSLDHQRRLTKVEQ